MQKNFQQNLNSQPKSPTDYRTKQLSPEHPTIQTPRLLFQESNACRSLNHKTKSPHAAFLWNIRKICQALHTLSSMYIKHAKHSTHKSDSTRKLGQTCLEITTDRKTKHIMSHQRTRGHPQAMLPSVFWVCKTDSDWVEGGVSSAVKRRQLWTHIPSFFHHLEYSIKEM